MKMKKVLPFAALLLFGAMSSPASAEVVGGWSEDTGYFTNSTPSAASTSTFAVTATSTPTHTASKEYSTSGSTTKERVIGKTTWTNVEHYTRARYEYPNGTVESDSGRVWGVSQTTAVSGWNSGDFTIAKTYYGN